MKQVYNNIYPFYEGSRQARAERKEIGVGTPRLVKNFLKEL